jgi:hypothetical protein
VSRRAPWLAAFAVGLAACGAEDPDGAIYVLAGRLEHDDPAACERLFPSSLVPGPVARALKLPAPAGGDPANLPREQARCEREFRSGDAPDLALEEARVHHVTQIRVAPQRGVTAAARAQVRGAGGATTFLRLVEHEGEWRVVLEGR